MKTLIRIVALLGALVTPLSSQAQIIAPGHVEGNGTSSPRSPTDTALGAVMDQALGTGSNNDVIPYRIGGVWGGLGLLGTAHAWTGQQTFTSPIIQGGSINSLAGLSLVNSGFNQSLAVGGTLTGNHTLTVNLNNIDSIVTLNGNANFSAPFLLTGGFPTTLTTTGITSLTLPTTGTLASTANNLGVFAATTSAQLAGVLSDETGTGPAVFGTAPTITGGAVQSLTNFSLVNSGFQHIIATGGTLTANRTMTINVNDAARNISLSGDLTLAGAFSVSGGFNLTMTPLANSSVSIPASGTLSTLSGTESLTNKTINGNTWTAGTGTLTISSAKTLAVSNTLTFTGTDGTSFAFPNTSDTVVTQTATQTLSNKTNISPTITGGTHTGITNLGIRSTGTGAFDLTLANTENLTAGRTLTLTLNNAARNLNISGDITTSGAFTTAGAFGITLTATGATNITLPTSGTLAVQNASNTFSATNTFSASNTFSAATQFTDAKFSSGKIYPTSDSTTALQVTKADGTTRIVNFDTTNARVGINKTAGAFDLDVNGATNVGGRLTFSILDGASLASSPSTITDMTINNSPSSTNDYIGYYNAASSQWRRATIGSIAAAASGGVQNINGLCSGTGCSIAGGTGITIASAGSTVTITNAGVLAGGGGIVPTSGGPSTLLIEQMTPGGRLTVVSGGCNVSTDQVAQTTLYYAPCGGEWVPVYDGTNMELRQFTSSTTDTVGLSLSMASSAQWTSSVLYDGFVGLNSGTLTLCTGPAWTNSLVGTSTRGTGAGTTELQLFKGMWTNKNSMTCRYGAASTFTCAVNQCTYVGTVLTGLANGQIDLQFGTAAAGGGLARLAICNQYNRADVRAASSDTSAAWSYTSATWRAANAGNTKISIVSCMGDIGVSAKYFNLMAPTASSFFQNISIGLNASNAIATRAITCSASGVTAAGSPCSSTLDEVTPLGLSTIFAIESADGTHATNFNGQASPFNYMQLSLSARM